MRYRLLKKFISVIIASVMLTVPFMYCIASASELEKYPIIHVPGIMHTDIYNDVNNPDAGVAWPPSTDSILGLVSDCIPALLEFSVTRDWDKLGNTISPLAIDFFGASLSAPDGTISNGSGIIFEYPSEESLNNNPNSTFKYDWREDPLVTAEKLNTYINYILETTDSEKISIECHSLGGVITLTYLSLFGFDKIDAIAFNTTAIYGESYTGRLLCGDMVLSNDSLMSFMDFVADGNSSEELLLKIFDIIECAGLGEFIADMGNAILENLGDILLPDVVVPLFGKWLTIWAMVPDEDIDEAMDYTFTHYIPEDAEGKEELRENIENYNELVRKNKTATLLEADKHCKVGVISRYGYSSIPATSQWQQISDGVLDSKNSSFGATFALYGATLSDEIIESTAAEYISPDKTIDASSCLFPEKTWFIKNTKHSNAYKDLEALALAILQSDEEITVNTYEQFPRFMVYDFETDSIIPDMGESDSSVTGLAGFFAKIKAFIAEFFEKLRKFLGIV